MADKKNVNEGYSGEEIIAKAKDFWERYNRPVTTIATVIILLVGGYFVYKNFFKNLISFPIFCIL